MARNRFEIVPRVPRREPPPETDEERLARLERNTRKLPVGEKFSDRCRCTCPGCSGSAGFVDHCGSSPCINGSE